MNKTKKNQNNKRITKKNQIKHIRNTKKNKKHSLKNKMKGGAASFSWKPPYVKKSNNTNPIFLGSKQKSIPPKNRPGVIMSPDHKEERGPSNNREKEGIRYRGGMTREEILKAQEDERKAKIFQQDLKRREAGREANEGSSKAKRIIL